MAEKFEYYDLLGTLVPGILMLSWIPVCFPALMSVKGPSYPEAFAVLALTALAVLIGQLLQALGSILMEPVLNYSWGGRPSEKVFKEGLGNFKKENADRIRSKLEAKVGTGSADQSLFLYAMQLSESAKDSRVPRFNSLYAYHRNLCAAIAAAILSFVSSFYGGFASSLSFPMALLAILGLLAVLLVVVRRTKQRADYYVREVLMTAERVMDNPKAAGEDGTKSKE